MRTALALCLTASQAAAWEYTPGLPCTLSYRDDAITAVLTHDPRIPLYTITLTTKAAWPDTRFFALTFETAAPLSISTDRHFLLEDGKALRVEDSGFGNVLMGMARNETAIAVAGEVTAAFPLAGAAAHIPAFRRCDAPTS